MVPMRTGPEYTARLLVPEWAERATPTRSGGLGSSLPAALRGGCGCCLALAAELRFAQATRCRSAPVTRRQHSAPQRLELVALDRLFLDQERGAPVVVSPKTISSDTCPPSMPASLSSNSDLLWRYRSSAGRLMV